MLSVTAEVLAAVRRAKTAAKRSMRATVERLQVVDTADRVDAVRSARGDLCDAGGVQELVLTVGEPRRVDVTLAAEKA